MKTEPPEMDTGYRPISQSTMNQSTSTRTNHPEVFYSNHEFSSETRIGHQPGQTTLRFFTQVFSSETRIGHQKGQITLRFLFKCFPQKPELDIKNRQYTLRFFTQVTSFLINHISNFNTFDAKCLDFIKVTF